ncbi:AraC family transcriptional regulator [Falsirhodobacter xinxiangensis]|uniref:AraC family transcriptional regulator n=1 Tax=Falsirhodobacter xinxiangensis TaxID=2530049 RepID=UPI0010AA3893|nr:AraC family transcriptional regulator [Rhodobacter xinxiangensis]
MQDQISPMRLVPIPRLAAGGRWRVEAMRSISEPLLLWFTKGQGRITVAGQTRGYTAHNAIFIPAGVMHGFEVGQQVFGQALFFGRDHGLPLSDAPRHLRIREVLVQQELNVLLDNIQRESAATTTGADRAARHWCGLLSVWLDRQVERGNADAAPDDATRRLVARYADLLEREFRTGMNVADLAAALGVTPTHLTRCCKATCGRPASALLHDRILFEARHLLAETDMPVAQIAKSLGFASPAYFTRAFSNLAGASPTAFRRAN